MKGWLSWHTSQRCKLTIILCSDSLAFRQSCLWSWVLWHCATEHPVCAHRVPGPLHGITWGCLLINTLVNPQCSEPRVPCQVRFLQHIHESHTPLFLLQTQILGRNHSAKGFRPKRVLWTPLHSIWFSKSDLKSKSRYFKPELEFHNHESSGDQTLRTAGPNASENTDLLSLQLSRVTGLH